MNEGPIGAGQMAVANKAAQSTVKQINPHDSAERTEPQRLPDPSPSGIDRRQPSSWFDHGLHLLISAY